MILSSIRRYLIIGAGTAIVALSLLAWLQHRQIASLGAEAAILAHTLAEQEKSLQRAREAHRLAEAAVLDRDRRVRDLQLKLAQRQKDLDHVLKDNRSWADQPVPPGVSDWLRKLPGHNQD